MATLVRFLNLFASFTYLRPASAVMAPSLRAVGAYSEVSKFICPAFTLTGRDEMMCRISCMACSLNVDGGQAVFARGLLLASRLTARARAAWP